MRVALLSLLAIAGCKSSDGDDHPNVEPIKAEDDTCDPAHSKVCVGPDVVACEPSGHLGRRLRACHDGCNLGRCNRTCDDEAVKVIYAVDSANELLRFDPRKLPGDPFTVVGQMNCTTGGFDDPFSMAVDRNGFAWVVYQSGNVFKVSVDDATCQPTTFDPGSIGSTTFGMGFVTDQPGGSAEHLYLSGNDFEHTLIKMDPDTLKWSSIGRIEGSGDQSPELTGTGDARMFGFYPMDFDVPYVQEIDKSTGKNLGKRMPLAGNSLGDITAYAFAQWGGKFYAFATSGGWNNVYVTDAGANYATVRSHTPFRITGAGVSTCAPEKDGQTGP